MEDTIYPLLARLHTNILIEAQYLPVVLNIRAERESCFDHHDWKIVVHGTKLGLGPLRGEPVCLLAFNSTSTVLQLETRPSFGSSGCVFPGLEQNEGICIPSLCSFTPLPQTVTRP